MKNYSLGWRKFDTEFDGDEVTCEVKPLSLEAWLLLQPCIDSAGDELKLMATGYELLKVAGDIFGDSVKNITGFLIDGEPPTTEGITGNMCFITLVSIILIETIRISVLNKEESKNSNGLSASQQSGRSNTGS